MHAQSARPCVAILDRDPWLVRILQATFQTAGYPTVTPEAADHGWEPEELAQFIKREDPQAVVYDVTFPYEEHYRQFQQLLLRLEGKRPAFVLTTTGKTAVQRLAGSADADPRLEIVSKPFDLEDVLRTVERALPA
jgi:DNA-binding NtrC family response regulator